MSRARAAGRTGDRLLTIWAVVVFAFLFLPIVVIILSSFNSGRLLVAWDGFSLAPFAALVEKPAIRDAVGPEWGYRAVGAFVGGLILVGALGAWWGTKGVQPATHVAAGGTLA